MHRVYLWLDGKRIVDFLLVIDVGVARCATLRQ